MIVHPFPSFESIILSTVSVSLIFTMTVTFSGTLVIFHLSIIFKAKIKGHTKYFLWLSSSRYIISKITVKRNRRQNKKRKNRHRSSTEVGGSSLYKCSFCSSFCFTVETENDLYHTLCSLCRRQIMARYYWMLSLSTWSWLRETTSACTWRTSPWIHQSVSCFKSTESVCVCVWQCDGWSYDMFKLCKRSSRVVSWILCIRVHGVLVSVVMCACVWPVVNNSIIHAVKVLVLSVCQSIFYSAGWIPTSPSGNSWKVGDFYNQSLQLETFWRIKLTKCT